MQPSQIHDQGNPPAPGRSGWWSPRGVAWLGGLFIAAMAGQAAFDIWRGYHGTLRATERDLDTQSRVIAEQTARGVQAVDVVLKHLAEQLGHGALAGANSSTLHLYLKEQAVGLVQADGLVVFGPDGAIRAVSQVPLHQVPPLNVSKDPPFANLRDANSPSLHIDKTQLSPGTRRWVFPIGRRLADRDGRFFGVVGAPGKVEYFQKFYRDTYPDPSTRISLLHREGWLLARHPPVDTMLGKRLDVLDTLLPRGGSAQTTVARLPSPIDGVDHFVAVRVVPEYPLVVAVSRDAAAALAPWRKQALTTALRTLALGALAAGLLWAALRQLVAAQAARKSLELSEERYALAMTGSNEGHWIWDIPARQVYISARLAELFSIAGGAQVLADSDYFAHLPLHPEDRERVHRNRNNHVAGLTPRLDHEFRIVVPGSGEVRWVHTRAQCFRDADGQPLRMAGSSVDITERKQAELESERLQEQLRQAQKLEAIGTLAGGIAHDFNNILSAILGYGELAQKGAAEGTPLRRHLDAAIAAGQRAKSLVERTFAFSRSGMGERVPVHVQSVVEEALDSVAALLPPGVRLVRGLHAGDAGVLGDPTQIHQVVMNLCANAVQAMKAEGRLEVSLDVHRLGMPLALATHTLPAGDYLRLSVADSGVGIAPALLERIFDPFFTTKEVGVGTGLGLSLVHGIVTDLGGGIAVQSCVGEGSVFTVYIPSRVHVVPPKAEATDIAERGQGQTVLLVDDEETLVRLGEEMLAELGYEPVGFVSSSAALEAYRAEPERFDVLLTDEAMPGLSGSQLAREARALRPLLPIVLMSGFVSPGLAQRAREAGVAEVLNKPLASCELACALATALRGSGLHGAAN
jgi:PAS domain S-box-containing protein